MLFGSARLFTIKQTVFQAYQDTSRVNTNLWNRLYFYSPRKTNLKKRCKPEVYCYATIPRITCEHAFPKTVRMSGRKGHKQLCNVQTLHQLLRHRRTPPYSSTSQYLLRFRVSKGECCIWKQILRLILTFLEWSVFQHHIKRNSTNLIQFWGKFLPGTQYILRNEPHEFRQLPVKYNKTNSVAWTSKHRQSNEQDICSNLVNIYR